MKFKNILVASMIMGAGVFASSAYAANVAETANATLTNNGVGGLRTLVGNAWDAENSGNTFTDKFLFTLTGNYNGSGTLSSTFESTSPVQDLLITYAGYNVLGVPGTGTEDYWKFTTTGLTAGSYYIAVNGVIQGAGGGTYTSNVNFALAPVPEPETYAMMAAGLGLLGFMARRRKSAKQA
jgi:hypothetical protein